MLHFVLRPRLINLRQPLISPPSPPLSITTPLLLTSNERSSSVPTTLLPPSHVLLCTHPSNRLPRFQCCFLQPTFAPIALHFLSFGHVFTATHTCLLCSLPSPAFYPPQFIASIIFDSVLSQLNIFAQVASLARNIPSCGMSPPNSIKLEHPSPKRGVPISRQRKTIASFAHSSHLSIHEHCQFSLTFVLGHPRASYLSVRNYSKKLPLQTYSFRRSHPF